MVAFLNKGDSQNAKSHLRTYPAVFLAGSRFASSKFSQRMKSVPVMYILLFQTPAAHVRLYTLPGSSSPPFYCRLVYLWPGRYLLPLLSDKHDRVTAGIFSSREMMFLPLQSVSYSQCSSHCPHSWFHQYVSASSFLLHSSYLPFSVWPARFNCQTWVFVDLIDVLLYTDR